MYCRRCLSTFSVTKSISVECIIKFLMKVSSMTFSCVFKRGNALDKKRLNPCYYVNSRTKKLKYNSNYVH